MGKYESYFMFIYFLALHLLIWIYPLSFTITRRYTFKNCIFYHRDSYIFPNLFIFNGEHVLQREEGRCSDFRSTKPGKSKARSGDQRFLSTPAAFPGHHRCLSSSSLSSSYFPPSCYNPAIIMKCKKNWIFKCILISRSILILSVLFYFWLLILCIRKQ